MTILHFILAAIAVWLISGALLNFSKHPHWYIRIWDFPRIAVAILATAVGVVYGIFFHTRWWDYALLGGLAFVVARQFYLIYPYTPIARESVKWSQRSRGEHSFRLVISNVLMENTEHEEWLRIVTGANPDIIVAVEIDQKWDQALSALEGRYPFVLRRPQDNYYGMVIYSRLPFEGDPDVRYLVQDDIPSARVMIQLRDGSRIRLHALHPRPPEPINDQSSAPRDAELITLGKEIAEHEREVPTIVCGDLNDVAWSFTTQLFLRLSRLLDPRRGRGTYNSFNAKSRFFRFPLDHVFHSDEFKLIDLRVLPYVGSDHFPVLIELSCEPEAARAVQPESTPKSGDHEDAEEILETQEEREVKGKEHGHAGAGGGHGR